MELQTSKKGIVNPDIRGGKRHVNAGETAPKPWDVRFTFG
jgi:hypothetical protein